MGIQRGRDVVIASKHGWPDSAVVGAGKLVFDVCDDHFSGPHAAHYVNWCRSADAVTCNTSGMARVIQHATGRTATVIGEPHEQPECEPRINEHLLWFGHRSNLDDLQRVLPSLGERPITVLTNLPTEGPVKRWTREAMDAAFERCGLVILPTGRRQAKSANRAVESIRRGLFVVAEPLPAYSELGVWIGDIAQGVQWALSHQEDALMRVAVAQAYVAEEFSPRRIAEQWLTFFESL